MTRDHEIEETGGRMKRLMAIVFVSAVGLGTFATGAQAATLGITVPPVDSFPETCFDPDVVVTQLTDDPSTPYHVPGPGTITQWQLATTDESSGEGVSLVVLKPTGAEFTVVAVDSRTIADPAPGVSSYTPATPISVSGGETFGLIATGPDVLCYFRGGSTPHNDSLAGLAAPDPLAPGQTLARGGPDSDPGYTLNLAATFMPTTSPTPPKHKKKRCKKKHKKRSAESAKKKKCKKKKKR
jgi:hypothetical protein